MSSIEESFLSKRQPQGTKKELRPPQGKGVQGNPQKQMGVSPAEDIINPERLAKKAREAGFERQFAQINEVEFDKLHQRTFETMGIGEFKLIPYTQEYISKNPEKQGQIDAILFKSATGENLVKKLAGGWTEYVTNSLIQAIQKRESPVDRTPLHLQNEKARFLEGQGFREKSLADISRQNGEPFRAVCMNMPEGQFLTLSYPAGESDKKGYIHTVIYKVHGRIFIRSLTTQTRLNGLTESEANALVADVKRGLKNWS